MKTFWLITFILSITVATACAQDIIVLKSGVEIKSKVIEITPTEIKYKRFDNLDGPTIVIAKTDVTVIKYKNGTKDVISPANSTNNVQNEGSGTGGATNSSSNTVSSTGSHQGGGVAGSISGGTSLYFMPLGFLEFGPVFGADFASDPNLTIGGHLRIPSLGLLTYAVTTNDDGDAADKMSGLGIGADIKYYSESVRNGFYFGGLLEYLWGTATYYQGGFDEYRNSTTFMVMACNCGYKFGLSRSVYINLGGTLGAAVPVAHDQTVHPNDPTNLNNWNDPNTTIFGMLDLTFGINL
ncbi:MAG TPA: hypothetical protein VLX91_07090 [Candidatus Acidoferrales bacterium]|nr:hypothetical protein [Candidatus Acidoferrales bacterium]